MISVKENAAIRGDWEAKRLEWVPVDELLHRRRSPVVPRLYDAFDSVWPPWPTTRALEANLQLAVDWLKADRQMGAGTLARCAGSEVIKMAGLCGEEEFAVCREEIQKAIEALRVVRPSMTSPANLMQDFREALDRAGDRLQFLEAAERLIERSCKAEENLARNVADRITAAMRVMTISYSSTVSRALQAASDRVGHVYVCEGRPLCEGRQLAEELREAGAPVTLLTDAQMLLLMPQVDMVLLGADSVVPGHGAINKVGSALLALAARQFDKPVIVAAESLKRIRDDKQELPAFECGTAGEVWQDVPEGIDISNVHFELVSWKTITHCIDEDGDFRLNVP